MGPGSLRRAIERKSPMLLHRSVRTGSSILANYSANGLFPLKRASRAQLRIPGRMEFSERTGAGTGQPRASSIFIDPLHEYAASGYGLFPFVPPARRSTFGNSRSLGHRVFSHAFANSQLYLRSDAALTVYFGECSACSGGTGHHSYSFC